MDKILKDKEKKSSVLADGRRFSIIPKGALAHNLSAYDYKILAALCLYTNPAGVCHPTQETLEHITGFSKSAIATTIKKLQDLGLLRLLKPDFFPNQKSAWKTNRYQILYDGKNTKLPSDQELKDAISYNFNQDTPQPTISIGQDQVVNIDRDLKGKRLFGAFNKVINQYGLFADYETNKKQVFELVDLGITEITLTEILKQYIDRTSYLSPLVNSYLVKGVFTNPVTVK